MQVQKMPNQKSNFFLTKTLHGIPRNSEKLGREKKNNEVVEEKLHCTIQSVLVRGKDNRCATIEG